jgi:hypothetical protein
VQFVWGFGMAENSTDSIGGNTLSTTIQRLALIADDDQISVQAPTRVAEALRYHGHLLEDREMAMLTRWLGER